MSTICLIYGCTGQDGSYLCKSLLEKGYEVVGISRSSQPDKKKLCQIGIENDLKILTSNLDELEIVQRTIEKVNPNYIYNLSAQSSVGLSFKKPYETYKSIGSATNSLLEACRLIDFKGRIFFAGSSEIYGNTNLPAKIGSNVEILSPYAYSKYQSYLQVRLYREIYGLNAVTGVLFNHESPIRDNTFVTQKIISGAIECSKNKFFKLNLGNINIARDWGWAEDFVEAIHPIIHAAKLKDHIICTGKLTKLTKFIDLSFKYFNLNWRDHVISNEKFFRKKDIIISYGDPKPLKKDLNWEAKIGVKELINNLIEHKLQNQ